MSLFPPQGPTPTEVKEDFELLIHLTREARLRQKAYFRNRQQSDLQASKDAEKKLDLILQSFSDKYGVK